MATIEELIQQENELARASDVAYGAFAQHAKASTLFLSNCVKSMDRSRSAFGVLLSGLKKHHTLAYLSLIRRHRVQANMNLRQVLEFAALAAYAIVEPDHWKFLTQDDKGLIRNSRGVMKQAYDWLDATHPGSSKQIKYLKDTVNQTVAHASLSSGFMIAQLKDHQIDMPFFDTERNDLTRGDLWIVGSSAIVIADLLFGANEQIGAIEFLDDFIPRLNALLDVDRQLRAELMASDRYKEIMAQYGE